MSKIRHMVIPAVYVILRRDNQVLLGRRLNTGWKDGEYTLPSGHVEKDEFPKAAIIREAKEEIGVKINTKDLKLIHMMHRITKDERADFFFECWKWDGDLNNMEPEKCDDLDWFDIDNLPENTISHIKRVIKFMQSGTIYSESVD